MAEETVLRFIQSYDNDEHVYSWVMDVDDILIGTIGAYDYENDQIEVGFSVVPAWQGKGYASEALTEVIKYLSENENIPCIKAWCAAENIGSKRVLEKAGMTYVNKEKNGIEVNGKTYDKLNFEYRR